MVANGLLSAGNIPRTERKTQPGPVPGLTFVIANARMVPMMKNIKFGRRMAAWISGILIGTACLTGCAHGGGTPLSQSSFLLDTFVTVTIYGSRHIFPQKNQDILQGSMDLCKSYEDLLSTTRDTSEIYKINHREPGTRSMTVSEDTARVIERGLEYGRMSGGAFDITVEPLSSLWDFKSNDPQIPDRAEIEKDLHMVDYRAIRVEDCQVLFDRDDTRIDLGAIAKGFIADRLKEYLEENGVTSAVINLGGNVLCLGERPDGEPFKIGLQKPFADHQEAVAALNIWDMSVVSSGVYERHFVKDGVNYHHILNPRTGFPYENGLVQVSIISKESVDGDGLSTTCFALGLDRGIELLDSLDDVYGIFMTEDGELHYSRGARDFLE